MRKSVKTDKQDFVEGLAEEAERAAASRNMKQLYDTTKKLAGKFKKSEFPIRYKNGTAGVDLGRYSVSPSAQDFPTEYQIRRNSTPAGLPVFVAIWGPDFRAITIILNHMFKQIKQIRITVMAIFKVIPSSLN